MRECRKQKRRVSCNKTFPEVPIEMTTTKTETLIIGGGIAGLALARRLQQQGHSPRIIEQREDWDDSGYGLGLWGNGLAILDKLGFGEEVREVGTALSKFEVRRAGGELLAEQDLDTEESPFLAIHRSDLHRVLREPIPSQYVQMGVEPTDLSQHRDGVEVVADDERRYQADVVIGADGIHSTVRELVFDDWELLDCSTVAWSFWAPDDVEVPDATTEIWAPGTEAYITHVDGRGLINLATTQPAEHDIEPPAREYLQETAEKLGWILPDVVEALPEERAIFCDINQKVRADRWVKDRIALMGDAAHALHPISGQGASLALEDAWVLGEAWPSDTVAGDVTDALESYTTRRQQRVAQFQRQTAWLESATFSESSLFAGLRNVLAKYTPIFEWFLKRQSEEVTDNLFEKL